MSFNSLSFLGFFPSVVVLYYLLPRSRLALLLVASCMFYMALIPGYIVFLFLLIGIDYAVALYMEPVADRRRRLIWLLLSLISNLGMLFFFKYFNFFADNLEVLFGTLGFPIGRFHSEWVLPIGLSFHTFQSLSYTIEVYYGRQRAERNLG